jgi:hypothetical protein
MVTKIMVRAEQVVDQGSDADFIKIALPFLKTKGVVKEQSEITLHTPRPTVIKYGTETTVLGYKEEGEEDE